jgi:hypothetical protein
MKFYLESESEKTDFKKIVDGLLEKNAVVEIKEIRNLRTPNQNRYLHLLLSFVALSIGETSTYFKEHIWKKQINPEIFKSLYHNKKTGEHREDWRSSSMLDTKEMTMAIDRLKDWSARELGVYLPDSDDRTALAQMEREIKTAERYL